MIGASRVSKKKKNIHIAGLSDWKGRLLPASYVTTGILSINDDDDDGNGTDCMMIRAVNPHVFKY